MIGKVLRVEGSVATVRIGREGKSCLTCRGDCARAVGEPEVEVQAAPDLRVGQVVRLRDRQAAFRWLQGVVFLLGFLVAATAGTHLAIGVGVPGASEKAGILMGLLGGTGVWAAVRSWLRTKRRYAVARIVAFQGQNV